MSSHPAPDRRHHQKFCTVEKWTLVTDARGQPISHHTTYTLAVPNGDVYRTRISHPVNRTTYAPSMWSHVLRDQLQVTAAEFWDCVDDGVLPNRGARVVPSGALSLQLVNELVKRLGLSREQIADLSNAEAVRLLAEYWSGAREG